MLKAAIVGATGYTGRELVALLSRHPGVRPFYLTSDSYAGKSFAEIYPQFRGSCELTLEKLDVKEAGTCDIIFAALPHGTSLEIVPHLLATGKKVVDLSGDFRLKEAALYPLWYGYEHKQSALLAESVYGLPEHNREAVRRADLVANPGCYPTSVQLPLIPLLQADLVEAEDIIIDAKSGVSGAGRTPKQPYHFPECAENFKAYKVTGHQHTPEIEQGLAAAAGRQVTLLFTPHLVPMIRGILSTMYLRLKPGVKEEDIAALYRKVYADEPFIRLLPAPSLPETKDVSGTNFCDIAFRADRRTGRLIVISAIDNLVKGAAGQAVQNMNIMLGLPETAGLM
ncbi:MAG TPA: N-acetyl-gamma-glutamyl-phosphate reductase [Firmicutes bacterium]|nr:N-acetyl-gamma-glutamyl-phosphate reductase [Bacillota bacterium]